MKIFSNGKSIESMNRMMIDEDCLTECVRAIVSAEKKTETDKFTRIDK